MPKHKTNLQNKRIYRCTIGLQLFKYKQKIGTAIRLRQCVVNNARVPILILNERHCALHGNEWGRSTHLDSRLHCLRDS